jgi:N-formylglutamate amidohydrolase
MDFAAPRGHAIDCEKDSLAPNAGASMPSTERAVIAAELNPAFTIAAPQRQTVPFVFSSPHSGRIYPSSLLARSRLDPHALRRSEDCFVEELFADMTSLGAPLIAARFPRAYLDLNREPYELDPELFDEELPPYANTQSIRVAGGLGTIARIVADGEEIYRKAPTLEQALDCIELLYKPYHRALADLLAETHRLFGYAILIDCHSMPSASAGASPSRPHFVLGDRFGSACEPRITRLAREVAQGLGYDVLLNRPYAGGFITEHYGRPAQGFHAMQIEINRALYLNEQTLLPNAGFSRLKSNLLRFAETVVRQAPHMFEGQAAAE